MRKAIFVDRDGTINEMVYDATHGTTDSPRRPEQVHLKKGVVQFLKGVADAGFFIVVVTNQPGIAKGTLTVQDLDAVNAELSRQLATGGARWDAMYYCPHHPDGGPEANQQYVGKCDCRKPAPGLLLKAADDHGIDLRASWMIGDGINDIQAGNAAGCRTILLARLKIEHVERFFDLEGAHPDHLVESFEEAGAIVTGE